MSHDHNSLGAVARSSGLAYAGWRSWARRSRTSALAARTRYIVRSLARYVPSSRSVA